MCEEITEKIEKNRESFIFYHSFFEAIEELDDKKRLKMYDSIAKLALKNEETEDLKGICKQLFALIKPQITANNKRYEDGKKGGRPTKEKTSGYSQKKPNENENVNENVNENAEVKKTDPFINQIKDNFEREYKKVFEKKPCLTSFECNRLIDLANEIADFAELIPIALSRLKGIRFKEIGFKPSASWLLRENNFAKVINGEFEESQPETEGKEIEQSYNGFA